VAKVADASGLVVMEAFHWRYHPVAERMVEIIRSGELGALRRVEATFAFPLFKRTDIRWQHDLAGGALMDAGCYAIHMTRTMAGSEPDVVAATAKMRSPTIDRAIADELAFADGVTGRAACSMWSSNVLRLVARAEGEHGSMRVLNPLAPQYFHRITVRTPAGVRRERVGIKVSTYERQLAAFVAAVRDGAPTLTPPEESVANMRVIDAAYRAAGLSPRVGATDL
jgi:predicted dehydrogenase